jgi:single-stranded DNA-binding protein
MIALCPVGIHDASLDEIKRRRRFDYTHLEGRRWNWQSRTDWHPIVSFGKQAEFTRTLTKGSYVMVQAPCALASMNVTA